ncbi:MAG: SEC-C domain-containing protein [Planctomycetales bacterium]|nr:SEC-C domain-containing protein [Planctomycetales bacterium]
MSVNPYAPCPCGSGKKLKFCCSDLVHEIEKIDKLIHADQPRAALARCEQLLAKTPDRASLLDLAAMLKLSLEDIDGAAVLVQQFLQAHPESPTAHAQAALLAAAQEDAPAALDQLQTALELCGHEMPQRVLEAIGAVGHALLLAGDIVAARAYLLLYAGISPDDDNQAIELLLRLNMQSGLPLLLREPLNLVQDLENADKATTDSFAEAVQLGQRGLWRRAAEAFAQLRRAVGPLPPVVFNLALCRGWCADKEAFAAGMHEFAALAGTQDGVPHDDAVEAEALAQLVAPGEGGALIETVCLSYPAADADVVAERLASDKRVESYPVDPETFEPNEETPPRNTYLLLDRPAPESGVDIAIDRVPNVLGFVSLYGKRTDRSAMVKLTTDNDQLFSVVTSLLAEIVGDAIGGEESRDVLAEKPASEESLSWRWRLPDDTPPAHRRELLAERRRRAILEDWIEAPQAALGGVAPQAAAEKTELKIPLAAAVLIIEQAAVNPRERSLFVELREKLKLPAAEQIDPDTVDLDMLPLVRIPRLELAKLDPDQLSRLVDRCTLGGAAIATVAVSCELLSRDVPFDSKRRAFQQIIRTESDPDEALVWLGKAKEQATTAGEALGEWLLMELQVQLERADAEGIQATLREIADREQSEPEVAQAAYQLLYRMGLVKPPGTGGTASMGESRLDAPAAAASGSKLWTPDSDVAGGGETAERAIWTP